MDIFDNEYAEIKLHRYTSVKHHENINDQEVTKTVDEIIPLINCNYGKTDEVNDDWNLGQ